jgi:hypothetical protein
MSHAEGFAAKAEGARSHAEGTSTVASGHTSHAEGSYTIASGNYSHVEGKYNIADDDSIYTHIIGNGTGANVRSNAHTVDWYGNAWYAGDVYVGSTSGVNKDSGSKKLATEEYVDTSIANLGGSAPGLNPLPQNAVAGDLLIYDGTNWVCISKADLIAEIIAALPNAEEAEF